ncbi:MAG: hypothetical protein R2804_06110 [Cyclobacteriaceae bacterium]
MLVKCMMIMFLFVFTNGLLGYGQPTYKTVEGHIVLIGEIDQKRVVAESHKLYIQLDYKTKEVFGRLDLKSIDTGIEHLNKLLKESEEPLWVSFSGTIPVEDFISLPHKPIVFKWPVTMTLGNNNFDITLNTTLTHFNGGEAYACMLSASGDILAGRTSLPDEIPGLGNLLKIQFTQVILRR